MSTSAGMGTRTEIREEGGESLGTFQVVMEVGRKTRGGWRRQRVTSNHNRKTRCLSEIVTSCEGLEPRGVRRGKGSIGEGGGEAKKRNKHQESYIRDVGNGVDLGGRRKKRGEESIGPVRSREYY